MVRNPQASLPPFLPLPLSSLQSRWITHPAYSICAERLVPYYRVLVAMIKMKIKNINTSGYAIPFVNINLSVYIYLLGSTVAIFMFFDPDYLERGCLYCSCGVICPRL